MAAGPGEMAYLEQLRPVFGMFGLERPPGLPRMGGYLLEPSIRRLLAKYNLTVADAMGLKERRREELARADTVGVPAAFSTLRAKIAAAYQEIFPGLALLDKGLPELGGKNLDKVLEQVNWLEKRALASHGQKHRELTQHFHRLETALAPGGVPQERVHNCVWYLNKYGPGFIDVLLRQDVVPGLAIEL